MGFYRQFEHFDPIAGRVPYHPFSVLPAIARRARRLLIGRTRDEILSAANTIDWFVDSYFEGVTEDYIQRAPDWVWDMLPEEDRTESGLRLLLSDWPSSAPERSPIPTREDTSDLEALQESIDRYTLDESDFPSPQKFEYFAVLALWKLADAVHWLNQTDKPTTEVLEPKHLVESFPAYATVEDPATRYSLAGECALEAMDALCWGEHLQADDARSAEMTALRDELRSVSQADNERVEARVREKISVAASRAAIKRHQENHAMKAQVFAWCAQHLHEYSSMDRAAEATAGTLVPVTFRTARVWIAEWKKRKQRSARTP